MEGEPTARIICAVTRKIPLPMTVPITIEIAAANPKVRGSCGVESIGMSRLLKPPGQDYGRHESDARANDHVPSESNAGCETDIEQQPESRGHSIHGGNFSHATGEQPQQEDP